MNILVMDDNEDRQRWLTRVLFAAGFSVCNAFDGELALELCRKTAFDVAFIDHDLGSGLDGSQVMYRVLSSDEFMPPKAVWVQSSNPVGALNISAKCESAGIPCFRIPFEAFCGSREKFVESVGRLIELR